VEQYLGAEAFIEVLNANRVDQVFFNPGGDLAPIQAAVLKYRMLGRPAPRLVLCLHESVALAAAHGHYMVTGKPQVVLVHSELGTQQLGGNIHNAQWGRIPVVICAGLAAAPQRTNWKNEPYDQGQMVRNCVKWDHEVGPGDDLPNSLQHAFDVACTEPHGPVYLSYARALLSQTVDPAAFTQPGPAVPAFPAIDTPRLKQIADLLITARDPLIVAGYTGRHHESVQLLIELAETLSAPVLSGLTRMNFPTNHPLCAGVEHMGGSSGVNTSVAEADVILAIDYDSPYVPAPGFPRADAAVIHIDVDPLTQGRPLWGRRGDIFVSADSRQAIPALTAAIRSQLTPEIRTRFRERFSRLENKHLAERRDRRQQAISASDRLPISPDWLALCLARVIDDDTILVDHLISQAASVTDLVDRTQPGTILGCAGGNIAWALGAALGAKVAAPDRTVVSLMTDGGFVWGCPVATLWSASAYHTPFLSVIFNNQSYGAIRTIVESLLETPLSDEMGSFAGVDISPPANYALLAEACGGYGRMIDDPSELLPALKEAMAEVRDGRLAVIDVRLAKG
jgi:acetolactate synthase-1/2/3 large subunit